MSASESWAVGDECWIGYEHGEVERRIVVDVHLDLGIRTRSADEPPRRAGTLLSPWEYPPRRDRASAVLDACRGVLLDLAAAAADIETDTRKLIDLLGGES